ncbi:FAD-dependent oxidoreductase [Hyphomonas adhaerens]|nr:flavocytochrome c [Hyphomonas adhaerens]
MARESEIVVVGGGAAGFCAALRAVEHGFSVIVLEKTDEIGGSSAKSGGCLAFAGTDIQKANNIDDGPELLERDLIEVGKGANDPDLVRAYVDAQHDTYEWLKSAGVTFSPVVEAASGQSAKRAHNVDPADMVRVLRNRAVETGKCEVVFNTRAGRLVVDDTTGRVAGVVTDDGLEYLASRAVLLASGGFAWDAGLLKTFSPAYEHALIVSGKGNEGDGLRMAWKLGADLRDMAYIKGTFGKHPFDETNDHSLQAVYKGAIAVNEKGNRFVDESISYKLLGDAVMAQSNHVSYQILDQAIFDTGDNRVRIMDFERRLEEGLFYVADSLEGLAAQLEIDPSVLKATIDRYNSDVAAGQDKAFGRSNLVHHHGALRPIETPPFYAYPSTAVVFGTYCGLRIDPSTRVIDVFGEPIPGLYAVGEVTGGFHGAAYMTGSALGKAVVFGRIFADRLTADEGSRA